MFQAAVVNDVNIGQQQHEIQRKKNNIVCSSNIDFLANLFKNVWRQWSMMRVQWIKPPLPSPWPCSEKSPIFSAPNRVCANEGSNLHWHHLHGQLFRPQTRTEQNERNGMQIKCGPKKNRNASFLRLSICWFRWRYRRRHHQHRHASNYNIQF